MTICLCITLPFIRFIIPFITQKPLTSHAVEIQECQITRKGTQATDKQAHKQITYIILKISYFFIPKQYMEEKWKLAKCRGG